MPPLHTLCAAGARLRRAGSVDGGGELAISDGKVCKVSGAMRCILVTLILNKSHLYTQDLSHLFSNPFTSVAHSEAKVALLRE